MPLTDPSVKHRLTAILAADAAGFSRLMAADEGATVAALDAARIVFRQHTEAHHGRVIDMAGDSVLAVFETATGAVSAALAIQAELTAAELGRTIHAHPTLSEIWMEAAHALHGECIHAPPKRR